MSIGDGMLAQALFDYFQQHTEEFEQFLLERAGIGDGYIRWRGEEKHKRLVLKITTLGSGPSIVSELDSGVFSGLITFAGFADRHNLLKAKETRHIYAACTALECLSETGSAHAPSILHAASACRVFF